MGRAERGDRGWEERGRWGACHGPELGGKAPAGIPKLLPEREPAAGREVPGVETGGRSLPMS